MRIASRDMAKEILPHKMLCVCVCVWFVSGLGAHVLVILHVI